VWWVLTAFSSIWFDGLIPLYLFLNMFWIHSSSSLSGFSFRFSFLTFLCYF
jgi:hypothetical protein